MRITLLLSTAFLLQACGGTGDACEEPGTTNGCPDGFGCQIITPPGPMEIAQVDTGGNIIGLEDCFDPGDTILAVCLPICESTDDCDEGEICDAGFLAPDLFTCRTNPPPSLPEPAVCEEFQSSL